MKYTNFRFFIEFIIIGFSSYLLISGVIALISWTSYRDVLTHPGQMVGLMLLYWWIPIPRMADMEKHNNKIDD
jgi:hypothetical protein